MNLLYDMHSHILPGVDDGAKTVDESLALLKGLKDSGVKTICLTPHFYTHKESLDDFLGRRNESYNKLRASLNTDIKLVLGAEVYVTEYLFSNDGNLRDACYEGTNYMLTEFSYSSTFHDDSMRYINKLMSSYGIQPVLAHVERYPNLLRNPELIEELIYMGVVIQSNACSFSKFPLKTKLMKLLKNGYINIIGSDAHSFARNTPLAFGELSHYLTKKSKINLIEDINTLCSEILTT